MPLVTNTLRGEFSQQVGVQEAVSEVSWKENSHPVVESVQGSQFAFLYLMSYFRMNKVTTLRLWHLDARNNTLNPPVAIWGGIDPTCLGNRGWVRSGLVQVAVQGLFRGRVRIRTLVKYFQPFSPAILFSGNTTANCLPLNLLVRLSHNGSWDCLSWQLSVWMLMAYLAPLKSDIGVL